MNIFTSPIYFALVYFTLPVGTMIGEELIKFSCSFYVCLNVGYPDVPYKVIRYVTDLEFIFLILPIWILICMFWFFAINYFSKKIKEKKFMMFLSKVIVVILLVVVLILVFRLDLRVSNLFTEYKNDLRKGPPFTKMLNKDNTIKITPLYP